MCGLPALTSVGTCSQSPTCEAGHGPTPSRARAHAGAGVPIPLSFTRARTGTSIAIESAWVYGHDCTRPVWPLRTAAWTPP